MTANMVKVSLSDGREVCYSYGVAVAAFVPDRGYVRSAAKYSVTTSKHANGYAGRTSPQIPEDELERLIAPLPLRQR